MQRIECPDGTYTCPIVNYIATPLAKGSLYHDRVVCAYAIKVLQDIPVGPIHVP